jgi:hypothetical protein
MFGLSFGIAVATLTWIVGLLRPCPAAGWAVLGTLSLASVTQVALISMQKWRGVPSHFNDSTPLDCAAFSLMGLMVQLVGVAIVAITVWSFVRIFATARLALAVRAGLVLMLASQAIGSHMIAQGGNTFRAAGAIRSRTRSSCTPSRYSPPSPCS